MRLDDIIDSITPEEQHLSDQRMKLAAYLMDCIQEAGYKTRKDFAEAMGQQPSVVTKWLSGTHNFTADTLWQIGRVLSIELLPVSRSPSPKAITKVFLYNTSAHQMAEARIAVKADEHSSRCMELSVTVESGASTQKSEINDTGL